MVIFCARILFSDIFQIVRNRSALMTDKTPLGGVVCHYCHNPGHLCWDCKKLQNRDRRFQCAHESLKSDSTPSTMLVRSSKPNICLISFSSKWVIDSGATDHMTGNSSLFTAFQRHLLPLLLSLQMGQYLVSLGQGQFILLL